LKGLLSINLNTIKHSQARHPIQNRAVEYHLFIFTAEKAYQANPSPLPKQRPTDRGADTDKYSIVNVDWAGREPQENAEEVMVDYLLVVEDWSKKYGGRRNVALTVFGSYQIFVADERALEDEKLGYVARPQISLFPSS